VIKKIGFLATIIVIVFVVSCAKNSDTSINLYEPTNADTTAIATLSELKQEKSIYSNTCNACHQLYSPDSYTASQWKSIIPTMAHRTSLTSAQISLVTKYVTKGR
jgi:nitrate/TMAO reductase-like tetraheme cytochrome c subunit